MITYFFILMSVVVILSCLVFGFDFIYPLLYKDKYERRIAKIMSQRKKTVDEIIDEVWSEKQKIEKEKVIETRKKKLKRLNKI
jgi:hypothetical protein